MRTLARIFLCLLLGVTTISTSWAESNTPTTNHGTWKRLASSDERGPYNIAYQVPFHDKETRSKFPYRVVLEYAFDKEGSNRMPNDIEWERIRSYENALTDYFSKENSGVLAFTLISDGFCQIVAYVKDKTTGLASVPTALPKEPKEAKSLTSLRLTTEADPAWYYALTIVRNNPIE